MNKEFVDEEKARSIGLRLIALYGLKLERDEQYDFIVASTVMHTPTNSNFNFKYYFCEWADLLGLNGSPVWSLNTHIKNCNVDIPIIDFTYIEELEIKLTLAGY